MASRQDIKFASGKDLCAGWFYPATRPQQPVIVLGHGLGAIKEMGLDRYAERFQQAGFNAVAFDYRNFGESTGTTRQVLDPQMQLDDWKAALDYVETLEDVDRERIAIFGSSFGGGHAITVASREPKRVKAAVSQCPFTDGIASAQTIGIVPALWASYLAIKDLLFSSGAKIVPIPLAGKPGEAAMMNAPDVWNGYMRLVPPNRELHNYVAARMVLRMPFLAPGKDAKRVACPIFFSICGKDTVAPPGPTIRYAREAPKGTVRIFEDVGHFDIYFGPEFEAAVSEYLAFYRKTLRDDAD